jgi:predicted chitinase
MTNTYVPSTPPTPQLPAVKQPGFNFPFLRKAQGNAAVSACFTDEHDIYRLLALREPSGSYLVSRKGMWHGGIHITEAGAGQALDLDAGIRCIADGMVIAYRVDRDYPVSEFVPSGSSASFRAPYSTGFVLVQHEMEFPRGARLVFYSLYMHLMSNADYEDFPKRQKPAHWSRQWQVTQYAQDCPQPGPGGLVADLMQTGLRVRRSPGGVILGVLQQGASVSIGRTQSAHGATWGQLVDLNGATLHAPVAGGYVSPSEAVSGWIYLGMQNGGPVVEERFPDSLFDRVIVTADQNGSPADPQGTGCGIPVKAGDLMGHLGRYDSLDEGTSGTRMAHIEVFCGEDIQQFIKTARIWVGANIAYPDRWRELGLSAEPAILRIDRGTTLYREHANGLPGNDPKQTDVIQVYRFATLPKDGGHMYLETTAGNDGSKRRWWNVNSADFRRQTIDGWVREESFEGGRVTRENAQSWIDFECYNEDHDPTHTVFATTSDYVDYALGGDTPGVGSLGKLSPLMAAIYRVLYPQGDGLHAADDLCDAGRSEPSSEFPWSAFRASRIITKHESEWANPAKWQDLVNAIEERTGPKPEHEEEKKRIAKLVWWEDVAARISGFPESGVYHINPIGLVGNFQSGNPLITLEMLKAVEPSNSDSYYESILPFMNKYASVYHVDKPKRIAHFLSQAAHESQLRSSVEGLNYSARNMRKIFGCRGGPSNYQSNCDDCAHGRLREKLWSEEAYYAHNPENLANYVYASRMGNGDESSGDGYKYRGRGFIQVTGKSGYRSFQSEHNSRCPDDQQDFINNPDLLTSQLEYAVESAFVFWSRVNLNSVSDTGTVSEVTQIVNGGQTGFGDRRDRYNAVAPLLGLSE